MKGVVFTHRTSDGREFALYEAAELHELCTFLEIKPENFLVVLQQLIECSALSGAFGSLIPMHVRLALLENLKQLQKVYNASC